MRGLEERYPVEFRGWVENLKRLYLWRKAGYSVAEEGLDAEGWNALAQLTRWYEIKDLQAIMPAGSGSGK